MREIRDGAGVGGYTGAGSVDETGLRNGVSDGASVTVGKNVIVTENELSSGACNERAESAALAFSGVHVVGVATGSAELNGKVLAELIYGGYGNSCGAGRGRACLRDRLDGDADGAAARGICRHGLGGLICAACTDGSDGRAAARDAVDLPRDGLVGRSLDSGGESGGAESLNDRG